MSFTKRITAWQCWQVFLWEKIMTKMNPFSLVFKFKSSGDLIPAYWWTILWRAIIFFSSFGDVKKWCISCALSKLKKTLDHYKYVSLKDNGLFQVAVEHFRVDVVYYKMWPKYVFINGFNNIPGQRHNKLCIGTVIRSKNYLGLQEIFFLKKNNEYTKLFSP